MALFSFPANEETMAKKQPKEAQVDPGPAKAEPAAEPSKARGPASKKGRTHVFVYPDWCKGCGLCVAFCPGKVLELGPDGKSTVVREEDCVNCGFCELHCPDFAIVVKPVGEDNDTDPANVCLT
jgi:2-oxoglutarate ferredoxin oxidoreductase subunit delta